MLDYVFTGIYLAAGVTMLVAEIAALLRKAPGDTITEHLRWVDAQLHGFPQWLYRVLVIGMCVWLPLHLWAGGSLR